MFIMLHFDGKGGYASVWSLALPDVGDKTYPLWSLISLFVVFVETFSLETSQAFLIRYTCKSPDHADDSAFRSLPLVLSQP